MAILWLLAEGFVFSFWTTELACEGRSSLERNDAAVVLKLCSFGGGE